MTVHRGMKVVDRDELDRGVAEVLRVYCRPNHDGDMVERVDLHYRRPLQEIVAIDGVIQKGRNPRFKNMDVVVHNVPTTSVEAI